MAVAYPTKDARTERVDFRKLLWVGPLAIVLAVVANVIVYFIAAALGAFPPTILAPTGDPITITPVILTSVVGVLAGVIVFAIIGWLVPRPITVYRIVALIALVLSFITPFGVQGATPLFIGSLLLMHIVAGVITIWTLTTMARAE